MKSVGKFGGRFELVFAVAAILTCAGEPFAAAAEKKPAKYTHGVIIRLDGPILPHLESYLHRKVEAAKAEGVDLLIVEIDSPGGMLDTSVQMADFLKNIDWARTVAYVPREAISGAAIAALGCDEIIMAPHARLGDAGPIVAGPDSPFRLAGPKIVSYLTSTLRGLAEAKGRPPALAEAMADKSLKVFHVSDRNTGKETYISNRELKENPDKWKELGQVAAAGNDRFLAVTGQEAVKLGLADGLAESREDVARHFGTGDLGVVEVNGFDIALDWLTSGWITGLLLVLGLVGLYMELMAPGHGIGGLIAAVCFILLFWSHFLGGTAGWFQVLLFVLGMGCVLVEIFLLPGTIVFGLVGTVMILVSLVMVSQGFLVPNSMRQVHTLAGTMAMILISFGIFVAAAIAISRRFETLPLFTRLTLAPPEPDSLVENRSGTSAEEAGPRLGDLGVAFTPLRPGGKGRFGDRNIDVLATGDFLDRGTPIRVVRVAGNQVFVERLDDDNGT